MDVVTDALPGALSQWYRSTHSEESVSSQCFVRSWDCSRAESVTYVPRVKATNGNESFYPGSACLPYRTPRHGGVLCVAELTSSSERPAPDKSCLREPGSKSKHCDEPKPDSRRVSFVPDLLDSQAGHEGYRISEEVTSPQRCYAPGDRAYDFRAYLRSLLTEDEDLGDFTFGFASDFAQAASLQKASEFYCEAYDVADPLFVPVVWSSRSAFTFIPRPWRETCPCVGSARKCRCHEYERFEPPLRWGEPRRTLREETVPLYDRIHEATQQPKVRFLHFVDPLSPGFYEHIWMLNSLNPVELSQNRDPPVSGQGGFVAGARIIPDSPILEWIFDSGASYDLVNRNDLQGTFTI